jgi:hypothetical protein
VSSGEFGSNYDPLVESGLPFFWVDRGGGGASLDVVAAEADPGRTNLLLGVDMACSTTAVGNFTGAIYSPLGNPFYSSQLALVAPAFNGTLSWRGRIPYPPGSSIHLLLEATGGGAAYACLAWGVVLPYVAFAP